MTERKAEAILALTTVFWSGTFVFSKIALESCDALSFVILRFLVASGLAALLWHRRLLSMQRRTIVDGSILGALYGAGFYLQTGGLQYTTISKSAFITGMVVIFVPGADRLIRGTRMTRIHGIAVLGASVGLLLLTHPEAQQINVGDVMTLGGAILWSFYISFLDRASTRSQHVHSYTEHLVIVQFAMTVLLGMVVAMVLNAGGEWSLQRAIDTNWTSWLIVSVAYTAVLGSLASTYLQTKVQRFVPPVKAGIIFTLEPIFASIIAYFTHHERLSIMELSGAALMIGAIIFADTASQWLKRRDAVQTGVDNPI